MTPYQSKAGHARALALSRPRRKEIATQAALARWKREQPEQPINTPEGKETFIRALCDRLRDVAIERIPAMPSQWDGNELRQYLADLFQAERTDRMKHRRLREYKNTVATTSCL